MTATRAPAPIAFFAFNRPQHAQATLAALAANDGVAETDLHVFVDGARDEAEGAQVAAVVRVAEAASGFRSVRVHASPTNLGLYRAITTGVSAVVAEVGRVIVVEDDILVAPEFLQYMNDALDRYDADARIGAIHGYAPPLEGLPEFFFLRGGDCWGWATWADRWRLFDPDATRLLHEIVERGQLDAFADVHGIQGLRHLIRRSANRNQSWAAHWNASLFLASRLSLHPGASFVQNIGNDGTGTHSATSDHYATALRRRFDGLPTLTVRHDADAARRLRAFYDGTTAAFLRGPLLESLYLAWLKARARVISRRSKSAPAEPGRNRPDAPGESHD
jgi:hypothetical protein